MLLTGLFVAACGEAPEGARHPQTLPPPFVDASAQQAWQGMLACADCEGIHTYLVLDRAAIPSRYQLQETYLAEDGGERFQEQGQWRRDGRLLRLQPDTGGERVYAIEADGLLSLRDGDGAAPSGGPRLLAPVTGPSPP